MFELDTHCQAMLEEYRASAAVFEKISSYVIDTLKTILKENNIVVTAVEGRIKTEKSLRGKLELKGSKYASLSDVTDIVGCRVITFYSDDVDKVAALVESSFDIDWANSVDKRKILQLDTFGYQSLHYICRVPQASAEIPEMCRYRFEIQLRTALQHVWANMYHDTGYKSGIEIPKEYLRNLNRLAGMLELADEQFSRIRSEITDYRRHASSLVANGNFDDVPLNGDTFSSYLELKPFEQLLRRIAAVNQAEIYNADVKTYYQALVGLGFKTLGDIERLVKNYSEFAYELARYEIGITDLDIISCTIAIQDLCIVYILKNEMGRQALIDMLNSVGGNEQSNAARADRIITLSSNLSFMNK